MNKEYLGPTIKKGTFVCRSTVVGDFLIGKNTIDQLDEILRESKMPTAPTRIFDLDDVIRKALRQMRSYNIPPSKLIWEEDLILNYLDEDVCMERKRKWMDIMVVEAASKASHPNFTSFCSDVPYLIRFDRCIEMYDEIMAQAPIEA